MHIHILSPAGAIAPEYIDRSRQLLERRGYSVSESAHARGRYGRFSATAEDRLRDLREALDRPDTDYILCARGGYGLQQIVGDLPLRPEQKIPVFIGFSDITILHQWAGLCGRASLHGLMCKHLSELDEQSDPIRYWFDAIEGKPLHYMLPAHPLNRPGECKGRLIGGNLSVLYGLQATPWALDALLKDKPILWLEDIAERHYHIDRMMQNLRLSGVLSRLGGLVVGQWADCQDDPSMNCTVLQTIRQAVDEYDYPVLMNFPAGHIDYNLPLWLHQPTEIRVDANGATLRQEGI